MTNVQSELTTDPVPTSQPDPATGLYQQPELPAQKPRKDRFGTWVTAAAVVASVLIPAIHYFGPDDAGESSNDPGSEISFPGDGESYSPATEVDLDVALEIHFDLSHMACREAIISDPYIVSVLSYEEAIDAYMDGYESGVGRPLTSAEIGSARAGCRSGLSSAMADGYGI